MWFAKLVRQAERWRSLVPHAAIAVAYFAGYHALRVVSFSHFMLPSGLRVALLLMVPYRYWTAMVIGEVAALSITAVGGAADLGVLWSLCLMLPQLPLAMPFAWLVREKVGVGPRRPINLAATLALGIAASFVWTLGDLATFLVALGSGAAHTKVSAGQAIARWLLGNYVGVIVIAPPVLLLIAAAMETPWRVWARSLATSLLARELLIGYFPIIAAIAYLGSRVAPDLREIMQVVIFIPVAAAAFRHGYRGAAFVGSAASLGVMYPMPTRYDIATMAAQLLVAFIATTMMLWSEHVGRLARRASTLFNEAQAALALARRNVFTGEAQLRQTSQAVIEMRERLSVLLRAINVDQAEVVEEQVRGAEEQLTQLADWVYPQIWNRRGMPAGLHATLRQGELARVLDRAGIGYWCSFDGADLGRLPSRLNLLLYRLVVDAVGQMLASRDVNDIRVRLRHGTFRHRKWVMLRIEGRRRHERATSVAWDSLLASFPSATDGSSGIDAINDRVQAFEGTLRQRVIGGTHRLSVMMYEPAEAIAA